MTRHVDIRERAKLDLQEQAEYFRQDSPETAVRFLEAAEQSMDTLLSMPELGSLQEYSPARWRGLRSWPIRGFENYLIFYFSRDTGIEVVRVLHGARDIPAILRK
jgi:toxin ParE1/3/4